MANKKPRATAKINTLLEDLAIENTDVAESEDDLQVIDPSLLGQAVVFGTDWTAATLIDQLRRGNIKLEAKESFHRINRSWPAHSTNCACGGER
jgi:hypothetical protein